MITKWIGVVASVVLVLATAAILLRDWKYHDRRTKAYSVFTAFLFVVTLLAACGLGWHMWKTFPEPRRQPSFSFFLNGLAVTNGSVVTIPTTNKTQALHFFVFNTGNDTAESLTFDLLVSTAVTNFNCTGTWKVQAPSSIVKNGKLTEIQDWIHYRIVAENDVAPDGSGFGCDPLLLDQEIKQPFMFKMSIAASAKGTAHANAVITILYIPGTGEPFLNKKHTSAQN